jgi:D-glycerate 3-kinase
MQLVNECCKKVKKDYLKFLKKEKILNKSNNNKMNNLKNFYVPMSFWINNKYKKKKDTLILGLSGSQGSGKTTTGNILKIILKKFFKKNVFVISIDDFYKTLKVRNILSKNKHLLFKTRGVPGTHDINLVRSFFNLTKKKKFKKTKLPRFNKSQDDRLEKNKWYTVNQKPEIVIFEGWCVGAKPQKNLSLKIPINDLEKYEDKNLIWRKYVNEKLKNDYKKVFKMIDHFIFIKIPSFNMVYKWRALQESKLKKKWKANKKIMTNDKIKHFIMFYQRITLQMIKDLSKSASVVMLLKKNHEIKKIIFRTQ